MCTILERKWISQKGGCGSSGRGQWEGKGYQAKEDK